MKRRYVVLPLIALFIGCVPLDNVKPEPKPQRKEWPQTCEMCGAKWLVTPNDPGETVPPTVEWCFHDGQYCEIGFAMIVEQQKNGQSDNLERRWLNHCLSCKGCRCAAFDPDEWRKIADEIKKVRANQVR